MKKSLISFGAGLLLILSFALNTSAAQTDPGIDSGGGSVPKPICTNNGHCYYP